MKAKINVKFTNCTVELTVSRNTLEQIMKEIILTDIAYAKRMDDHIGLIDGIIEHQNLSLEELNKLLMLRDSSIKEYKELMIDTKYSKPF